MAKKKQSKRHAKHEEADQSCDHAYKAVRLQSIHNAIRHMKLGTCEKCKENDGASSADENKEETSPICATCICLRCSFQGCSRGSDHQHALAHYHEFPSHPLTVNIQSWVIWCYDCDTEVPIGEEKHALFKAVRFIRKHVQGSETKEDFVIQSSPVQQGASTVASTTATNKVTGLSNLGNTCFFNAVIQNISQTPGVLIPLKKAMLEESTSIVEGIIAGKPPTTVNLKSPGGPLTSALFALLKDFQAAKQKVISPGKLFGEVCKRAPMFRGYQQQDSQELLHYILDGIRSEELARLESALKALAQDSGLAKKRIPGILRCHRTFIDDLFGGVLVSSVICSTCKQISRTFDRFFDLSLPIVTVPQDHILQSQRSPAKMGKKSATKKTISKHQRKMNTKKERKKGRRNKSRTISQSENESIDKANDVQNGDEAVEHDNHSVFEEIEPLIEKGGADARLTENGGETDTAKPKADEQQHTGAKKEDSETDCSLDVKESKSQSPSGEATSQNGLPENSLPGKVFENPDDSNLRDVEEEQIRYSLEELSSSVEVITEIETRMKGGENIALETSKTDGAIALLCRGVLDMVIDLKDTDVATMNSPDNDTDSASLSAEIDGSTTTPDSARTIESEETHASDASCEEEEEEEDDTTHPRHRPLQPGECSIASSLDSFFSIDTLTGNNKFSCEHCRDGSDSSDTEQDKSKRKPVLRDATKQFSIDKLPYILILHMKRFAQTGRNFRKLNKHVDFPTSLDVSDFCSSEENPVVDACYSLYGIVEHSGSLNGGHYVAYVKTGDPPTWHHVSDSHVSQVTETAVLRKQAYLLFYKLTDPT